jgi:hypothetical protein
MSRQDISSLIEVAPRMKSTAPSNSSLNLLVVEECLIPNILLIPHRNAYGGERPKMVEVIESRWESIYLHTGNGI